MPNIKHRNTVFFAPRVLWDLLAPLVKLAKMDLVVSVVTLVLLVPLVSKEWLDHLVPQGRRAPLETLAPL